MFYYLNGILRDKSPVSVILDVCGVGYELRIPVSTYEQLPDREKSCALFTHLYVSFNQDEVRLYGFGTIAEKSLFLKLISISGIGPKIALSVLSSLQVSLVIRAIQRGEDGLLSKVPGIGKKTAQRIIMELKDNIAQVMDVLETRDRGSVDAGLAEVEQALVSLGYPLKDIQRAFNALPESDKTLPPEQIIKNTIKLMYQKSGK